MRTLLAVAAMFLVGLLVTTDANFAQDKKDGKKEVVLKGKICCNKCELSVGAECATVIVVKDDKSKKDVVYFFDAPSDKKYHDDICVSAKDGTVTGIVKEADKKKIISVKKLEYAK